MTQVTRILERVQQGDARAEDELLPLLYNELRQLAAAKMAQEAPGQTLQPTALVHEAWLRLGGDQQPSWRDRGHFFAAAAEAMRRILIDTARKKGRLRHGKGLTRIDLDQIDVAAQDADESILAVDEALSKLAEEDPVKADLVKLRYFVGLSIADAGEALGLSESTAKRNWNYARAWLYRELKGNAGQP